ncbi:efflux RND transporter periplasmic adaptor subunit [Corallococcus sp. bb12-1]|uniref:efflux RND transporter periplasmic adaptor subunit n=1 Tax=Corallococcus sp. bb12-1 TaxID=2996784 RepID=UPI0022710549|nr:efflux RND transporter periplasmic adaptor subunit [Corallococcus sp. bb12-1]MCY1043683.1 efflux RND transporter periplasmic adaptor subunit [Corallococcus sp. bb12-1]
MAARTARVAPALLLVIFGAGCAKEPRSAPAEVASTTGAGAPSASAQPAQVKLCQHGVPAELCTRCNPEFEEVFKAQGDWCAEHGVPESQCLQCNPKRTFTAQAPQDWCAEHSVPESRCTRCNPALVTKFIEAGDYCREHGFPLSVCPIHHPELAKAAGASTAALPRVRLASAQTESDTGLRTQRVERKKLARTLEVVGQLDFNQNRRAQLSARGEALILETRGDVGDEVKAGQPLLMLASASVGEGQAQLVAAAARVVAARSVVERERHLVSRGISAQQALEAAEAELAAAQGASESARATLGAAGAAPSGTGGRYALTSPFAGTIVARNATIGRSAVPGEVLFEVADLSTLWAWLEVPEAEAGSVRPGQKVILFFEGQRGPPREATLSRVASSVDPRTRTVRVRVELPNPDGSLKAGAFLRARIQVSDEKEMLLVPQVAVQRADGKSLVFVKTGAGIFEPTQVELGDVFSDSVEVVKGLASGAEVVTTGAFLLKTEVLKDSIGAGCCEEGGG